MSIDKASFIGNTKINKIVSKRDQFGTPTKINSQNIF